MFLRKSWLPLVAVLLALLVAGSVVSQPTATAGSISQPAVWQPGAADEALRAAWVLGQSLGTDEARIRSAVDTYFRVQYESRVNRTAIDPGFLIDGETQQGEDLYNYELGLLKYCLACYEYTDTIISGYSYAPQYDSIDISGTKAVVLVHPRAEVKYKHTGDRVSEIGNDPHAITLAQSSAGWRIIDDEYGGELHLQYPRGTDFEKLLTQLPQDIAKWRAEQAAAREQPVSEATALLSYLSYDRDYAAGYAEWYSCNDGGDGTDSYNPKFACEVGYDCCNFVSQCIWYAFGGVDNQTEIDAHDFPMVDGVSGTNDWWCDQYGWCGWPNTWTYIPCFLDDMLVSNMTDDSYGVQGRRVYLPDVDVGDLPILANETHTYIINDTYDYDDDSEVYYNEIYVCAHSANRRDVLLSNYVPNPSNIKFYQVVRFKY